MKKGNAAHYRKYGTSTCGGGVQGQAGPGARGKSVEVLPDRIKRDIGGMWMKSLLLTTTSIIWRDVGKVLTGNSITTLMVLRALVHTWSKSGPCVVCYSWLFTAYVLARQQRRYATIKPSGHQYFTNRYEITVSLVPWTHDFLPSFVTNLTPSRKERYKKALWTSRKAVEFSVPRVMCEVWYFIPECSMRT